MPKKKKVMENSPVKAMTGKQLSAMFLVFLLANSAFVYIANSIFPSNVVLGNHLFPPVLALFYSMLIFTLITVGMVPVIETVSESMKYKLKDMDWMVLYFIINTAALWLVAKFALQLGLGISSWFVAVVLAVVLDLIQGILSMMVVSKVK